MDKTDYRILRILKENGRESASDIGKEIHLVRVGSTGPDKKVGGFRCDKKLYDSGGFVKAGQ